jgi:hypothetical protein
MMALHALRVKLKQPLDACKALLPKLIALWNRMKGPIDDLSKVLAHTLGKFGPISPMCVIWNRGVSTMFYNSWRLYTLSVVMDKMQRYSNYEAFQKDRIDRCKSFEDFLRILFDTLELPASLTRTGMVAEEGTTAASSTRQTPLPKLHQRIKRIKWNDCADYLALRLNGDKEQHVPIAIEDASTSPSEKKKRLDKGKKKPQRNCKFCTYSCFNTRTTSSMKHNYFEGHPEKRSSKQCLTCGVALVRHLHHTRTVDMPRRHVLNYFTLCRSFQ